MAVASANSFTNNEFTSAAGSENLTLTGQIGLCLETSTVHYTRRLRNISHTSKALVTGFLIKGILWRDFLR